MTGSRARVRSSSRCFQNTRPVARQSETQNHRGAFLGPKGPLLQEAREEGEEAQGKADDAD